MKGWYTHISRNVCGGAAEEVGMRMGGKRNERRERGHVTCMSMFRVPTKSLAFSRRGLAAYSAALGNIRPRAKGMVIARNGGFSPRDFERASGKLTRLRRW